MRYRIFAAVVAIFCIICTAAASGRECDGADVLPLASDLSACFNVSKMSPTNLTLEEFQRSCVYEPCRNLVRGMGSLNCTLNNEPASILGGVCDATCSSNVTAAIAPYLKQCQLVSGVTTLTAATSPVFCKYDVCVQYTKLFAPLNCSISGVPAATVAKYCDNDMASRPPTTSPAVTVNSTSECSLDDTPLAYPDQLRQCLLAANVKVSPTGAAEWRPLCLIDPCAKAVRYFAGLSCTVGGTPASTLAKVCNNIIPLTFAPTTTAPPTPVIVSTASSPNIVMLSFLAAIAMALAS
ncbi:hypothetical protein DYB32_002204 [Aphanomyces invadans]|uniref:Uncharacterized protein n=1 Tax=Aphanomyces invadans TaxID=157072 RepID=A0A418B572_9STRA|nr:hypothetical protein DYB32_002204 [Aphanomyces invadans]